MDAYFFQGDIEEPVYYRLFLNHLILNLYQNQERDNANLRPPNPERLEQIFERIIIHVPV